MMINDIDRKKLCYEMKHKITTKENSLNKLESNDYYELFENENKSKRVGIYYKESKVKLDELVEKMEGDFDSILYMFSYTKVSGTNYGFPNNICVKEIPYDN